MQMQLETASTRYDTTRTNAPTSFRVRVETDAPDEDAVFEIPAHLVRMHSLLFEPVFVQHRSSLLVVSPYSAGLRINGAPAPRVAWLRVGDELVIDASTSLRVGEYRQLSVEAPAEDVVGQLCGCCRTPISADSQVHVCQSCGQPLHFEQARKPETERLECALLAVCCPCCSDPLPNATGGEIRWGETC